MDIYASDPIRRTNPRSPVLRLPFIDDGIPHTTILSSGDMGRKRATGTFLVTHRENPPDISYSSNVFLRYHSYSSMPLRPLITPPTPL